VLVPDQHYAAVSDWINGHHLKARVVYYRVPDPARADRIPPPGWSPGALAAKLDIRDTPFAPWLERELARRADFECVETMAEFRRAAKAITKAGQFKGDRGRHEKDDRFRIDDRGQYVLGWSNERKLAALLRQATSLAAQLSEEAELYRDLVDGALGPAVRLEQERIRFAAIERALARLPDRPPCLSAVSDTIGACRARGGGSE